jgi:hypothetical protein
VNYSEFVLLKTKTMKLFVLIVFILDILKIHWGGGGLKFLFYTDMLVRFASTLGSWVPVHENAKFIGRLQTQRFHRH